MLYKLKIILFLMGFVRFVNICQGNPLNSTNLSQDVSKQRQRSLWSDLFSYFYDTSDEWKNEDDNYSEEEEYLQSNTPNKYEICRDCNISYQNRNSIQYINHYYQPVTKGTQQPTASGAATATATAATTKKATAQTKATATPTTTTRSTITIITTPSATVSSQGIITNTTSTTPITKSKAAMDANVEAKAATSQLTPPTTITTTTMNTSTLGTVDVTIPPAPVPLDPLLEPSDSKPSDEALTSEENV